MASVEECRTAIARLGGMIDSLEPALRERHVPDRSLSCRIKDLDAVFAGRIGPDGVSDFAQLVGSAADKPQADVRVVVRSDDLLALADGRDDFLHAWLRGRVQVSAGVRDILRLRSLLGL